MRLPSALFALLIPFVTIGQAPCDELNAGFTWSGTPNGVQFSNGTTGNGVSTTWLWSFGDNTGHTMAQPFHTYSHPGTYEVCLTAVNIYELPSGEFITCQDTACALVQVGGDPCSSVEACFVSNDLGNGNFFFDNCTSGPLGTQLFWDFGDGNQSTVTNVEHHFDQPGTYTVCLFAYWQNCADTTCTTVTVVGSDPCIGLNAEFTYFTTPNGTQFSNGTIGTGIQTSFSWTFGDGTSSTDAQPFHTYAAPGSYEACLQVLTIFELAGGELHTCIDTTCNTVIIGGGDPCDLLQACFVPIGLEGGNFFFDNCTSGPLGIQYSWDFGDGNQSTVTNVEHHFDQPGIYTVCLFAYWQNCVDTTCTTVTVISDSPCDSLNANFIWSGGVNGVNFANEVIDNTWTYYWQFGDGTTANGPSPYHTYPGTGSYETCLTVWTWDPVEQDTCFQDHCELVVINGNDPCDFLQACFQPIPWGTNAYFFNNCTANEAGTQYEWTFGDGSASNVLAPTHIYTAPGTYTVCLWATWQNCADSTCYTIIVEGGDPCIGLNAGFSSFTTPNGTQFSNATTGAGIQTSFSWTFGDGSGSGDAQPFHTYAAPGSYEACLQVLTYFELAGGGLHTCIDTTCNTVIIGGGDPCDVLDACFVPNDLSNGNFFFDNCTNGPVGTQYSWDFGDGAQSTMTNVDHHYSAPGAYSVCLFAYWQNCVDTTCTTIIVTGGNPCDSLTANFIWSGGVNGVNFANDVIDNTWTYYWQFGDGTTDFGPNPYHVYPGPGSYETCLTVWTWDPVEQDTCFQDHCELVVINGNDPCDFLQACFQPIPWGTNAYFFNNCTANEAGTQYEWTFGDGSASNVLAPTHIYTAPGTYTVCLWATWQNCADSTCYTIIVEGGDPCIGLNAGFSSFTTPNGTQFSNATTGAGIQTSFSWTFGDGTSSTDAQPFHTYAAPGSYEACLQVLTYFELAGGGLHTCIDTTCNTVIIGGGNPCDDVQACYVTSLLPNNGVFLDNCSSGPGDLQFSWRFGDGSSSTVDNAEHYYDQPGTYTVCLIAFTQECADTLCTDVVIGDSLGCNGFTTSFEVEATGTAVVFYGQSSIPADGMSWSFGDGTYGEGSQVTHLYEPPGPYEVCLTSWYWNANTQDSCYAQSCQTIDPFHVGIGPVVASAAFNLYPQPANDRLTITGAALSTPMQVRFFGMDGKLEQQEQVNALPHQLDISTLAPAVHLLQLELDGQRFNYRVVVE